MRTDVEMRAPDADPVALRLTRLIAAFDDTGGPSSPHRCVDALVDALGARSVHLVRWVDGSPEVMASAGSADAPPDVPAAAQEDPDPTAWVDAASTTALARVPLPADGAGSTALLLAREDAFTPADLGLVDAVARLLRRSLRASSRRRGLERLAASAPRLAAHLDPAALAHEAARVLLDITGARWTLVASVCEGVASAAALAGDPPHRPGGHGWPRAAADLHVWPHVRRGATYLSEDLLVDAPGVVGGDGIRSLLCAPVVVDGAVVALLYAAHTRPASFGSSGPELAELLAGRFGAALTTAQLYRRLASSERRLRSVTDAINDLVLIGNPLEGVLWASASWERALGIPPDALVGTRLVDRIHPDDRACVAAACRGPRQGASVEHRLLDGSGSWTWVESSFSGAGEDVVLSARLVGERRRAEAELRERATHDPLTGLANRTLALEVLDAELTARTPSRVGLLFCDLDRFKVVNDRLGHAAGDELLRQVAARVEACLRPGDLLARLGGDEFVVVLPDVTDDRALTEVGRRVLAAVEEPFDLAADRVRIGASIGGVVGRRGPDGHSSTDLLRDADAAMYEAKSAGRGRVVVFDAEAARRSVDRLSRRRCLQEALVRDELSVSYEPVVDLVTGRTVAHEALLHWDHPVHGTRDQDELARLAAGTGALPGLRAWLLDAACAQLARWHAATGRTEMSVAVQCSPEEADDPGFAARVLATARAHGLPPHAVRLELGGWSGATGDQRAALDELAGAGVHLVLDDFGVGSSTLDLHRLPVDGLRVEGSIVRRGAQAHDGGRRPGLARAVLHGIITIADEVGLAALADGLTTPEQRDLVLAMGCRRGQGPLFGPPMDAAAATDALVREPAGAVPPRVGPPPR